MCKPRDEFSGGHSVPVQQVILLVTSIFTRWHWMSKNGFRKESRSNLSTFRPELWPRPLSTKRSSRNSAGYSIKVSFEKFSSNNGMDINWKCDFLCLKAVIYKGEFMEDCHAEKPSLDGILKICVRNYKGFNHIRRRGISITVHLT